jgi:hypothetical protein
MLAFVMEARVFCHIYFRGFVEEKMFTSLHDSTVTYSTYICTVHDESDAEVTPGTVNECSTNPVITIRTQTHELWGGGGR